jgi:hypothetical protein
MRLIVAQTWQAPGLEGRPAPSWALVVRPRVCSVLPFHDCVEREMGHVQWTGRCWSMHHMGGTVQATGHRHPLRGPAELCHGSTGTDKRIAPSPRPLPAHVVSASIAQHNHSTLVYSKKYQFFVVGTCDSVVYPISLRISISSLKLCWLLNCQSITTSHETLYALFMPPAEQPANRIHPNSPLDESAA